MAGIGFGGGGDDGFGEAFVLAHTLRELHSAQFTAACLIFAPCASGEVTTDNHLYAETFATYAHCCHGVGGSEFPVGDDVGGGVEEVCGYFVKYLSFVGNALGKYDVKCRNSVSGYHYECVGAYGIDVAHFSVIHSCLIREVKIGVNQCCSHNV